MSDVQVFDGNGEKPEDIVSIPWGGFSVHADRKGKVTYHIFPHGHTGSVVLPRREFILRTGLSDEIITRVEYGALAMRKHLNEVQLKTGLGHDRQDAYRWTVEDKMKERAL